MRLMLLCLTLACGSATAGELFQVLTTVPSAAQGIAQEAYYQATGFKTIATILIDRTALNLDSHIITLTIKGRTYRLASIHQSYDKPGTNADRRLKDSRWSSQSTDDSGRLRVSDDGHIVGDFTLDGRIYRVMSGDGVDSLLESDEPARASPQLFQPVDPAPTAAAALARVRSYWAKLPEVLSITTVKIDKAAMRSDAVTFFVNGRRYHFEGDWKRTDPQPVKFNGEMKMAPGYSSWYGASWDGSGSLILSDEGHVSGNFTINQGLYRLEGTDDVALLIEHKPFQFKD